MVPFMECRRIENIVLLGVEQSTHGQKMTLREKQTSCMLSMCHLTKSLPLLYTLISQSEEGYYNIYCIIHVYALHYYVKITENNGKEWFIMDHGFSPGKLGPMFLSLPRSSTSPWKVASEECCAHIVVGRKQNESQRMGPRTISTLQSLASWGHTYIDKTLPSSFYHLLKTPSDFDSNSD